MLAKLIDEWWRHGVRCFHGNDDFTNVDDVAADVKLTYKMLLNAAAVHLCINTRAHKNIQTMIVITL